VNFGGVFLLENGNKGWVGNSVANPLRWYA
jgi:hypothetical protein